MKNKLKLAVFIVLGVLLGGFIWFNQASFPSLGRSECTNGEVDVEGLYYKCENGKWVGMTFEEREQKKVREAKVLKEWLNKAYARQEEFCGKGNVTSIGIWWNTSHECIDYSIVEIKEE